MKLILVTAGGSGAPNSLKVMRDAMRLCLTAPTDSPSDVRRMAGATKMPLAQTVSPLRMLLSYHYFKKVDLARELQLFDGMKLDLFADSGAFSAWTTGSTIAVQEYADWLAEHGHHFACAAALDVLSDAEGSFRQTEELRKLMDGSGPELIPVFHSSDDGGFTWLQRYIDAGYTYIGISPTGAIYRTPKLLEAWVAKAFRMRPPNVRYHGFGVTGWRVLRQFPWYSCDSSSWTSGFRYANLSLFNPARRTMARINMRDPRQLLQHRDLLASYGVSARAAHASTYDREALVAACIMSNFRTEQHLGRVHRLA